MVRDGGLVVPRWVRALKDSSVSRGSCSPCSTGTGGWTRISPVLLRYARIRGLLGLGGVSLSGMHPHLPVAGRGVVREPADACVSHPRCADACSSAGSYSCVRPASWVCASICELPFAMTVPLVREPTDVCASSRCCRKPAPICGFLLVRGSGLSDLHAHLAFAGHNPARELPVACVSYRCSGG